MCSGVLTAVEFGGAGDKWSGDTAMVEVQTLLETLLNTSLRSLSFTDKDFSDTKQNFTSWDYSQVLDDQDF